MNNMSPNNASSLRAQAISVFSAGSARWVFEASVQAAFHTQYQAAISKDWEVLFDGCK